MTSKASKYDTDFLLRQGWRIYALGKTIDSTFVKMRNLLRERCSLEIHLENETGLVFVKNLKPEITHSII